MFSHVYLGVAEFETALRFWQPVMRALGLDMKFADFERGWAGWKAPDADRPLFLVGRPYEGEAAPGNGPMVAFQTADRATVDRVHALALSLGARNEGAPGLRPHYHPNYYGAYLRDPDGNKVCLCCHEPEPDDRHTPSLVPRG